MRRCEEDHTATRQAGAGGVALKSATNSASELPLIRPSILNGGKLSHPGAPYWRLDAGATAQLPAEYSERAAYIVSGEVEVDGRAVNPAQMLVFAHGQPVLFTAKSDAVVMLLGGEPVGERFVEWNFVSSSKERIEQAKADWRAGRMKLPDLDSGEFIPLPPDPPPAASPLS